MCKSYNCAQRCVANEYSGILYAMIRTKYLVVAILVCMVVIVGGFASTARAPLPIAERETLFAEPRDSYTVASAPVAHKDAERSAFIERVRASLASNPLKEIASEPVTANVEPSTGDASAESADGMSGNEDPIPAYIPPDARGYPASGGSEPASSTDKTTATNTPETTEYEVSDPLPPVE